MAKPKHRVYCPIAMRPKMVFETEQKAMRFIEMNADQFKGTAPIRAYFCKGCGGWHVTHRKRWEEIRKRTAD
ncbi:MAG: hypothetical protein IJQ84_06050 [Paludibacteraceae bacterium]|nr:hypothetical protein [Paludibacteraceae bacterium]